MEDNPQKRKGFASMSPERLKEVTSKGGRAVAPENRAFSRDPELARIAGAEGGRRSHGGGRKPRAKE